MRMSAKTFHWPTGGHGTSLPAGQVHVYVWDLDVLQAADWEILNEEEAERARRFVFPRDRDRFVRARATLRRVLAGYSGIAAEQICFRNGEYGKPRIATAPHTGPIEFNLSHSADIAVAAVCRNLTLGIDVERVRPIEPEIAEDHFSPHELLALRGLDEKEWLQGFYRCWTGKEALLKGEGLGLNLPLDAFDVEVHPQRPAALLAWRAAAAFAQGWRLFALHPVPETIGTLAVRDPAGELSAANIRCFSLPA